MSTSEHTPESWTVEEYGDEDSPTLVIHKDSESRICFMATPGSHGDPAKIEANAYLIAAAPDMRAALRRAEQLADICGDWNLPEAEIDGVMVNTKDLRDEFRAALAKAEPPPLISKHGGQQ